MGNHTEAKASPTVQQYGKDAEQTEYVIDVVELMYRLIENAKYIILASLLGMLIAGLITQFLITPKYQATSKLYVLNSTDSAINLSDFQIGTYLTSDYQEVFTNWHVHEMVIQRLGLDYTYEQIKGMITIGNPSGTRVLYITITADDPAEAKQIANEYASVAREFITVKMETKQPNVFEEALLPSAPSSPNKTRNIILGFLLGALLAISIVVIRFILDDRIRTREDIESASGLTTLTMIPMQGQNRQGRFPNQKKDKVPNS